MGRVVVYARYSSDRQSESSIDDQIRVCSERAARNGAAVDEVFTDYAVSGATKSRPSLDRLLAELETIATVYVEDLSRLSRNAGDTSRMLERFAFAGVRLVGVIDGTDTNRQGSGLLAGVRAAMNQEYLAELAARTHRGLEGNFARGRATGAVPFGYKTTAASDGGRAIGIDEDAAAVVREVFAGYVAGKSFALIADELNARSVPTPRRTKRGWAPTSIRSMLDNAKYSGRWEWNKRQWRRHPETRKRIPVDRSGAEVRVDERPELAIIDSQTWQKVRDRRTATARAHKAGKRAGGTRRVWPLSGLLLCAGCETPLTLYGGTRWAARYRCPDAHKRGTCANRASMLEAIARGAILGHLQQTFGRREAVEFLRGQASELLTERAGSSDARLAVAERMLTALDGKIARVVRGIEEGESGALRARLRELEAQRKARAQSAAAIRSEAMAGASELPTVEQLLARVHELSVFANERPRECRERLRAVFDGGILCEAFSDHWVAHTRTLVAPLLFAEKEEVQPVVGCTSGEGSGDRI